MPITSLFSWANAALGTPPVVGPPCYGTSGYFPPYPYTVPAGSGPPILFNGAGESITSENLGSIYPSNGGFGYLGVRHYTVTMANAITVAPGQSFTCQFEDVVLGTFNGPATPQQLQYHYIFSPVFSLAPGASISYSASIPYLDDIGGEIFYGETNELFVGNNLGGPGQSQAVATWRYQCQWYHANTPCGESPTWFEGLINFNGGNSGAVDGGTATLGDFWTNFRQYYVPVGIQYAMLTYNGGIGSVTSPSPYPVTYTYFWLNGAGLVLGSFAFVQTGDVLAATPITLGPFPVPAGTATAKPWAHTDNYAPGISFGVEQTLGLFCSPL